MDKIAVVDLTKFLNDDSSCPDICKEVVRSFNETGILIVKDPRVKSEDNEKFIDMMEKYYDQPDEVKEKDSRPNFMYQIGSTPEFTEVPRDHSKFAKTLKDEYQPVPPKGSDHKWRFFWRAGELPKETKFPGLNEPNIIPKGFENGWEETMNGWSKMMLSAVHTVTEMAAVGFGWKKDTITTLMKNAPHLLAPTGSNLGKYSETNTIMAGFHYDLNFITIHGKSRYPGLFIWLRDGTRIPVKVPDGHLLCQAGKQFEWLTGGYVTCGFHEVIVSKDTQLAIEKAKKENRILWRVSSTLFSHIASDQTLKPLGQFSTKEANEKYKEILAGDQVREELISIKLGKEKN